MTVGLLSTHGQSELVVNESWRSELGNVLFGDRLQDREGNPIRLAYFASGKIDFTVLPA